MIQRTGKSTRRSNADPNDSDTLAWYSAVCGLSGKAHSAMPIARRILEIDPLTPVYRFVPGLMSLMGGDFPAALPPLPPGLSLVWHRAVRDLAV